jgi:hypothetical protein
MIGKTYHVLCAKIIVTLKTKSKKSGALNMTRLRNWLLAAGMAAALTCGSGDLLAQGGAGGAGGGGGRGNRGNFDPAQFQQQMLARYKDQLEFKDDAEWNAVKPFVQKLMDIRMTSFRGMGGRGRGGPGGGNNNVNPEADALQKAIDAKASNAELKAAVAKVTEARKTSQAELEKAQLELRKVLTVRQEAIATSIGLL